MWASAKIPRASIDLDTSTADSYSYSSIEMNTLKQLFLSSLFLNDTQEPPTLRYNATRTSRYSVHSETRTFVAIRLLGFRKRSFWPSKFESGSKVKSENLLWLG